MVQKGSQNTLKWVIFRGSGDTVINSEILSDTNGTTSHFVSLRIRFIDDGVGPRHFPQVATWQKVAQNR